jgi:hypothetical protein
MDAKSARRLLWVGEKFVLVDDGSYGHLASGSSTFDPQHAAFAAHPNAFGQCNFGWQGQCEIDGGTGLDCGIDKEADSARADIASLRRVLLLFLAVTDAHWQTKREAPGGALVTVLLMILMRLGHRTSGKLPVSMSIRGETVKKQEAGSQV